MDHSTGYRDTFQSRVEQRLLRTQIQWWQLHRRCRAARVSPRDTGLALANLDGFGENGNLIVLFVTDIQQRVHIDDAVLFEERL